MTRSIFYVALSAEYKRFKLDASATLMCKRSMNSCNTNSISAIKLHVIFVVNSQHDGKLCTYCVAFSSVRCVLNLFCWHACCDASKLPHDVMRFCFSIFMASVSFDFYTYCRDLFLFTVLIETKPVATGKHKN